MAKRRRSDDKETKPTNPTNPTKVAKVQEVLQSVAIAALLDNIRELEGKLICEGIPFDGAVALSPKTRRAIEFLSSDWPCYKYTLFLHKEPLFNIAGYGDFVTEHWRFLAFNKDTEMCYAIELRRPFGLDKGYKNLDFGNFTIVQVVANSVLTDAERIEEIGTFQSNLRRLVFLWITLVDGKPYSLYNFNCQHIVCALFDVLSPGKRKSVPQTLTSVVFKFFNHKVLGPFFTTS